MLTTIAAVFTFVVSLAHASRTQPGAIADWFRDEFRNEPTPEAWTVEANRQRVSQMMVWP